MDNSPFQAMTTQIILICTFLAGFSATILSSFVFQRDKGRISNAIILSLLISTCTMLISLFLLTDIFIQTTEGYNSQLTSEEINQQFNYAVLCILIGVGSFLTFISLIGWINSRWMGIITTILGVATFFIIILNIN